LGSGDKGQNLVSTRKKKRFGSRRDLGRPEANQGLAQVMGGEGIAYVSQASEGAVHNWGGIVWGDEVSHHYRLPDNVSSLQYSKKA